MTVPALSRVLFLNAPFYRTFLIGISALFFFASPVVADTIDTALDTQVATGQHTIETQKKVEQLDDETRAALETYRRVNDETRALTIYNDQIERLIRSQTEERTSLTRQLEEIEITQRNIVPLMQRMLEVLEQFIKLDAPFLQEERKLRITSLHQLMDRADTPLSEKFRRLLEAYQVEMDYGRTIEAYQAALPQDTEREESNPRVTVDLLRFGRVGLYYLTLDRKQAGMWDRQKQHWKLLPDQYLARIRDGLAIARKEMPPQLLQLPVSKSERKK